MNFQEEVIKIKRVVDSANHILVALKKTPSFDAVCSGLSLYLGLKKLGKEVSIFSEDKIRVEFSGLIGVDKISNDLGGKNFVISLDYQEGSIDKVSYNIEGDKFNLVVESKAGAPPLTAQNVHYSYSGARADLIFTINVAKLFDLGKTYQENPEFFSSEKIINIDCGDQNENFGKINLVIPQAACLTEIVALLLRGLNINLDQDIATNILAGVVTATNNFTLPKTNATTFEVAALALRAGGKKIALPPSDLKKKPTIILPKRQGKQDKVKVKKEVEEREKAPPDWLKPKIYKSSTLI